MKLLKRLGCLLMAAVVALGFVGCGKDPVDLSGDDGIGTPGDTASFEGGHLEVVCYEAGFGTDWLRDMARAFEQMYKGVTIKVNSSYISGELITKLENRQIEEDIVFALGSMFSAQDKGFLEDLSDVYNSTPLGDEKPVKQSMTEGVYNKLLADDGKIYQMNWIDSVCSIVINKTVLNKLFPDGYELPRTTDELLAFCNSIKKTKTKSGDSVYPFSICTGIGYWSYLYKTWWAQYEGYDSYYDYYQGYYHDATGARKLATNGEVLDQTGRLRALQTASTFLNKNNGYLHQYAATMDWQEAQVAFVGQGYAGSDMTECAMMVNGDWLYNEVQSYLISKPQELAIIKAPVISKLVEKLENKNMSDATLSAVIDAIDKGETSYAGVSAKDFARIKEARSMAYTACFDHCVGIPAWSKNKTLAKEFLKFMASDLGQDIYANRFNGLTMCYGVDTDLYVTTTSFVKSRQQNFQGFLPICTDFSSPLVYRQGFNDFTTNSGNLDSALYDGKTAEFIMNDTKTSYMANWENIIRAAR